MRGSEYQRLAEAKVEESTGAGDEDEDVALEMDLNADADAEVDVDEFEDAPRGRGASSLERLSARINLTDEVAGRHYAMLSNPKLDKDRNAHTDRANRAVTEQVLDPRTRMILLKLINKNVIYEINGCISTGKEANVYHAMADDGRHFALKIYKTTILTFKAREKYVTGEFRFRHGYSKHNPRKMVQVWAEKEFRNLKRLRIAGIPSPEPLHLKLHVLLMGFIGDDQGVPAPRLKDARITLEDAPLLYDQCIRILRTMYQECHLVHADFSEYNLLLHQGRIVVIDVSQSVEHDHPRALDFLRHDCGNVLAFFRPLQVQTLTLRRLFDFITDVNIVNVDVYLCDAHAASQEEYDAEHAALDAPEEHRPNLQTEETIFRQAFIPRTLDDVIDIERDVDQLTAGQTETLLYTKLTGLVLKEDEATGRTLANNLTPQDSPPRPADKASCSDDVDSTGEGDSDDSAQESWEEAPSLSKEEIRRLRKENKVKVKSENREKRKSKVPKHVKKRKEKLAQRH